jgi:phosphopantetheinyl transferase
MSTEIAHIEIARIATVLAGVHAEHAKWLSESEQTRLAEMHREGRRAQYLAGHWLTRVLLARASGDPPSQWRLIECRSQPPQVQGHDTLRVSITHSKDWIAAAVATVPIGIDLEQRPRTIDASVEHLLRNTDEPAGGLDADAMLQRWVVKEAWIKRNTESALPARLRQLHLKATTRDRADVRVDSHACFHFGLAVAPSCRVQLQCEVQMTPGTAFAITDLANWPR